MPTRVAQLNVDVIANVKSAASALKIFSAQLETQARANTEALRQAQRVMEQDAERNAQRMEQLAERSAQRQQLAAQRAADQAANLQTVAQARMQQRLETADAVHQQRLSQSAERASQRIAQVQEMAAVKAQASLDRAQASATGFGSVLDRVSGRVVSFIGVWAGIHAAEDAFHALGEAAVGFNGRVEQSKVAWSSLLKDLDGSKGMADSMITFMQRLAIETNTTFEQVEHGTRALAQGGIQIKEIVGGLLEDVLNVAASMGPNAGRAFNGLTLALGQIQEAGKLAGQEMRQLYNAGVNLPELFEVMSRQTGKTVAELHAMQIAGQITSDMFMKAFREWSQERFGDLARRQSATFLGAMQQIKESLSVTVATGFKPFFDRLSSGAQQIAKFVADPSFRQWGATMAGIMDFVLGALGGLISGFARGFGAILSIVQSVGQLIYNALSWINPLARHSDPIAQQVEEGVDRIIDAFERLGQDAPGAIRPAADALIHFNEVVQRGLEAVGAYNDNKENKALGLLGPETVEAYRLAQDAIEAIKTEIIALSAQVQDQKNYVKDLNAQWKEADNAFRAANKAVKDAEAALKPLKDAVRDLDHAITEQNLAIAEQEQVLRAMNRQFDDQRAAVERASDALEDAEMAVAKISMELRTGEAALHQYKDAATRASDNVARFQDVLNASKDALREVTDQVSDLNDRLKDVMETPLEGTRQMNDALHQQKAAVAALNAQYLRLKASGASDKQLQPLQHRLESARAQLEALRAENEVRFVLPEEQLRDLAKGGTKEISAGDKRGQIEGLSSQINALGQIQAQAEARVRTDTEHVRQATIAAHAAKAEYDHMVEMLTPIKERLAAAENIAAAAKLTKDQAELELKVSLRSLRPQQRRIELMQEELTRRKEARELASLELDAANLQIDPLREIRDLKADIRDDAKEALDNAKEELSNLVESRNALITAEKEWRRELEETLRLAEQYQKNLTADQHAADKASKGGGFPGGGNPLEGALESLQEFQAQVEATGKKMEETKQGISDFFTGIYDQIASLVPGGQKTLDLIGSIKDKVFEVIGQLVGIKVIAAGLFTGITMPFEVLGVKILPGLIPLLAKFGGALLTGLVSPIGRVIAVLTLLQTAWSENWLGIRTTIETVLGPVTDRLAGFQARIENFITKDKLSGQEALLQELANSIGAIFSPETQSKFEGFTSAVGDALSRFGTFMSEARQNASQFGEAVQALQKNEGLGALDAILQEMAIKIGEVFGDDAQAKFENFTTKVGAAFEGLGTFLSESIQNVLQFKEAVEALMGEDGLGLLEAVLQEVSVKIGEAFGEEAQARFDAFTGAVGEALNQLGTFINEEVLPRMMAFKDYLENDLQPQLASLGSFIQENVIPRLGEFKDFLENDVQPQLQSLSDYIQSDVIPRLGDFKDFLVTEVVPKLGDFKDFIADPVLPALTNFKNMVGAREGDTVIPALGRFKDFLGSDVVPALRNFKDFLGNEVATKLGDFKDGVGAAKDRLGDLKNVIENPVIPFLSELTKTIGLVRDIVLILADKIDTELMNKAIKPFHEWIGKIIDHLGSKTAPNTLGGKLGDVSGVIAWMGELASAFGTFEKTAGDQLLTWIKNATEALAGLNQTLSNIKATLLNQQQQVQQQSQQTGNTITDGLGQSIQRRTIVPVNATRAMIQEVNDAAHDELRAHSPSQVFIELGQSIGDGLALGIDQSAGKVVKAAGDLVASVESVIPYGMQSIVTGIDPQVNGSRDWAAGTGGGNAWQASTWTGFGIPNTGAYQEPIRPPEVHGFTRGFGIPPTPPVLPPPSSTPPGSSYRIDTGQYPYQNNPWGPEFRSDPGPKDPAETWAWSPGAHPWAGGQIIVQGPLFNVEGDFDEEAGEDVMHDLNRMFDLQSRGA